MKTGQVAIFTQPQAPMDFREYPVPSTESNDLLVKMKHGKYLWLRPTLLARTRTQD